MQTVPILEDHNNKEKLIISYDSKFHEYQTISTNKISY